MTAFTVISNALVAVGAKPFATTMQALRDNLYSVIEGDATAIAAGKQIARAALLDTVINRAKLDTGTASQAFSITSGSGSVTISLNPFSFFPANSYSSSLLSTVISGGGANADSPTIQISTASGSAQAGTFRWRYINA